MNFGGFGKDSGPNTHLRAPTPTVNFPSRSPRSNGPPLSLGDVQASSFKDYGAQTYRTTPFARTAEVQYIERTNSPHSQSPNEISKNSRRVVENDKSYLVPYQGRSRPLVSPSSQYVGGPHPQTQFLQQPVSSSTWGNNQIRASNSVLITKGNIQSGQMFQPKYADAPILKRTRSPTLSPTSGVLPESTVSKSDGHKRPLIDYRDLDAPEAVSLPTLGFESSPFSGESSRSFPRNQKPFPSHVWTGQSIQSIDNISPLIQEDLSPVSTTPGAYQSGRTLQTKHAVPFPKQTRSPTTPSPGGNFPQNPAVALNGHGRASDFRSQSPSPMSRQTNNPEIAEDRPMNSPALKRTKIPFQSSSDQVFEENLDPSLETERELRAKEKRLARFKAELSQPVESISTVGNQKVPSNRHHLSMPDRQKVYEDPTAARIGDVADGNISLDYDGVSSSSSIVGLCPDMCPEPERAERGRKGDLDQYERLDGDRNVTSEFLAVKKYTRTAEREALLIRPMAILQKTMGYLLSLLDEPYDDRFLGLYNFLWDRMRAIRMDLRMQHIFNIEAINLLEQMIRLHIIAMHELCEYTKGEGFSEGFDAHLNIEQMNKTSVELFQLYDDHRKKGIHVPSEREFRGYYALLKLDKHPGYKVEPAELSLDLAKMTPEMRQTPEILFARDVARACRTGNFIAFFRLAGKASYLQACLMHAHFSKLRTQALASLHCGLQMNQGIPVTLVAKWLGMEEDVGNLVEYHGFSVKDFEEPYMVKESTFINADNDFPVKRSKLVNHKKSNMVVRDVSFPSQNKLSPDLEVKGFQPRKKVPESKPTSPKQSVMPVHTIHLHDEEMHDLSTAILSPKGTVKNQMDNVFNTAPITPVKEIVGHEQVQSALASPLVLDFSNSSSQSFRVEHSHSPKFEPVFRNSFGKLKSKPEATEPITLETAEENRPLVLPLDSVHTPIPQPMFDEDLEDEEQISGMEEDKSDEVAVTYYDQEVKEAKLKLMLRIWKRHAAKKRELREHKQFAAHAALSSLSMGPPIWKFEDSGSFSAFNIDHVLRERHEIQQRSWSVLNPSEVVATKLAEKNPDANCLCWKLLLLPNESPSLSAAGSWLHSKLMPESNDADRNLLVSSPNLSIWSTRVNSQSAVNLTRCFSVIKNITHEDQIDSTSVTGASGLIFVLSDHIPIEPQKKRLHDIVAALPCDSRLPLLIVSSSELEILWLDEIDKSKVVLSYISLLKNGGLEKLEGVFLSDERLREGLEWLASESPLQINVRGVQTRDLVLSHLNSIEIVNNTPNNCIWAFNEALDRSMSEVGFAVGANPTNWPCPEIYMLDESKYLPKLGWMSASKSKTQALDELKLPALEDDLLWLSEGVCVGHDMEKQKSRLENCLIEYLTKTSGIMGFGFAYKEASSVIQKCTRLELCGREYYVVPDWVSIFRRIFSWRMMSLTSGEEVYVLANSEMESKVETFLPHYFVKPSFDEMVGVGGFESNDMEYEDLDCVEDVGTSYEDVFGGNDDGVRGRQEEAKESENVSGENDGGGRGKAAGEVEADKLSKLLERCNIVQNLIDQKLSVYF